MPSSPEIFNRRGKVWSLEVLCQVNSKYFGRTKRNIGIA